MKKLSLLLLSALLLTATPARAELESYTYDTEHTQIIFAVNHLGFSNSHGRFTKFTGGFKFDAENPAASSADMTIDTNSLVMDSAAWEKHLKNADFFNVEKFPTMAFKTTAVEKTGDNTGKITGDLTLLGVTKPVVFDVTYNKSGIHPYSKKMVAGFSGKAVIKRSEFGMTYGLPGVGDDVSVILEVEGTQDGAAAATPAPAEKK